MPQCFSLTRKGNSIRSNLSDVDDEICRHFRVKVDEKEYYVHWYSVIGLRLSLGLSFDQIEVCLNQWIATDCLDRDYERAEHWRQVRNVNAFLRENYTSDAWYERR